MNERCSRHDGGQLAFFLTTGDGSVLVSASAGYWRGIFTGLRPDVALLSLGGRPNVDGEPYQGSSAEYALEQVQLLRPARVGVLSPRPALPGCARRRHRPRRRSAAGHGVRRGLLRVRVRHGASAVHLSRAITPLSTNRPVRHPAVQSVHRPLDTLCPGSLAGFADGRGGGRCPSDPLLGGKGGCHVQGEHHYQRTSDRIASICGTNTRSCHCDAGACDVSGRCRVCLEPADSRYQQHRLGHVPAALVGKRLGFRAGRARQWGPERCQIQRRRLPLGFVGAAHPRE